MASSIASQIDGPNASGTFRPAPAPGPATQKTYQPSLLMQVWIVIIMIMPVCGTFYPPETYFGSFGPENQIEAILPYPITPALLVLFSLTSAYLFARMWQVQKIKHEPMAYLYFAVAMASCAWSFDPQVTFLRALRLLPLITLGVIFAQLLPLKQMLRLLVIAYLVSSILSILVSVAMPSLGQSVNMVGEYSTAWRGGTSHKNSAGYTYGIGLILAVFATFFGVNWRLTALTGLTCLLMIVMSKSSTGLLGTFAALAACGIFAVSWRFPRGVGPLLAVSLLLLVAAGTMATISAPILLETVTGRDMSMTGRTDIWEAVEAQIVRQPITGYGYSFWQADSPVRAEIWRTVRYTPPHAHNSWLDLLLQVGVFGLITVAFVSLRGTIVALIKASSQSLAGLMGFGILVLVLSRSFTEVQFSEPGTAGVFWLVWASVVARRA